MAKTKKYREMIKDNTLLFDIIVENKIAPFRNLSESIYAGKAPLKINTVDFIIFKILNKDKHIYRQSIFSHVGFEGTPYLL